MFESSTTFGLKFGAGQHLRSLLAMAAVPSRLVDRLAATSLTSSSDDDEPDRLSQLPPELLEHILELASTEAQSPGPLSRRLWPIQQAVLFRRVHVYRAETLRSFCDTLADRPQVGELVRELRLDQRFKVGLTDDVLAEVLASLPQLQALRLWIGDVSYTKVLLRGDAKAKLPHTLVELHLQTPLRNRAYIDPDQLGELARLDRLRTLKLDFKCAYRDESQRRADAAPPLLCPAVTDLALIVPESRSSVEALLQSFPRVRRLSLRFDRLRTTFDLSTALSAIVAPEELLELSVAISPPPDWRFPEELLALTSLKTLRIGGSLRRLEVEAFAVLSQLSVERLETFDRHDEELPSSLPFEAIMNLVTGPTRMPHLRVLWLAHLDAEYPPGWSWDAERLRTATVYDLTILQRRFRLPDCTEFSLGHCDLLREAATSNGIRVGGTTFDRAAAAQRAYDRLQREIDSRPADVQAELSF